MNFIAFLAFFNSVLSVGAPAQSLDFFKTHEQLEIGHANQRTSKFLKVPLMRQSKNYSCGAAAVQAVLAYNEIFFREGQLIKHLGSNVHEGTPTANILKFIDLYKRSSIEERKKLHAVMALDEENPHDEKSKPYKNWPLIPEDFASDDEINFEVFRGKMSPAGKGLIPADGLDPAVLENKFLRKGIPVVLAIQAYREDETKAWEDLWEDGHFVVAVGFDDSNYYFMDPSTYGQYTYIPKPELLKRWHDLDAEVINGKSENVKITHFALAVWTDKSKKHHLGAISHIP